MAVSVSNGWLSLGDYYSCRLSEVVYVYQADSGTRIMLGQGDFYTAESYTDVARAIIAASE